METENNFIQEIFDLHRQVFTELGAIARAHGISTENLLFEEDHRQEINENKKLIELARKAKEVLEMLGWLSSNLPGQRDTYSTLVLLNDLVNKYESEPEDSLGREIQELLTSHNLNGLRAVLQREEVSFENTEDGIIEAARRAIHTWELEKKRAAFDP